MSDTVDNLVRRFQQIGVERIYGLPIYNDRLNVEAVDFQPCEGGLIGVLVTPWFLNIMLLPDDTTPYQQQELGEKVKHQLESGEHEFVIGEDEEVGRYLFRTVTSPTNCYKRQVAAVASGQKALTALLTPPEKEEQEEPVVSQRVDFTPRPKEEKHSSSRRDFLRGFVPS
ncbi:[NiFe]-hydrogenase assembly chaperone HybE [Kaarinaea lacus]|jgi:[NiFe] hydrogenase assembly HybE family chaperone